MSSNMMKPMYVKPTSLTFPVMFIAIGPPNATTSKEKTVIISPDTLDKVKR